MQEARVSILGKSDTNNAMLLMAKNQRFPKKYKNIFSKTNFQNRKLQNRSTSNVESFRSLKLCHLFYLVIHYP